MTIKDREYYNYEGVDMGATFNTAAIDLIRFKGYFVQVVTTGSPIGTFYMYASNDPILASATDWDTAATTATFSDNQQIVLSGQLPETGSFQFMFDDEVTLQPGETLSVCARATTGTPAYVSASLNTREDQ